VPGENSSANHQKRKISGLRRLIELLLFIVASTLVIFVLSSIALLLYTRGVAQPTTVTLDIPGGSAQLIVDGQNVLGVPPVWTFNAGDTLVLDNRDEVVHNLGEWLVPPNATTSIAMEVAVGGEYLTSLHPTGVVTVSVEPSRFDFSIIAFTTFGFGIAVGIILYVGVTIVRAMGHDDEDDWVDS
jgi:hypothetical protein